jgi:cephalosporin hydroxylase
MFENDAEFEIRKKRDIATMAGDGEFRALSKQWLEQSVRHRYSYNFRWLGMPIIQYPADVIAIQELIWSIKPRVVIETGVARGGGLIFYASILQLLGGDGVAVGVELALGDENRALIKSHPMAERVRIIDGSSTAPETIAAVKAHIGDRGPVLVILDSNHTHEHVLVELELYSHLVAAGSYILVCDTVVDDLPVEFMLDRPWRPGDSPNSAVREFVKKNSRFEIDRSFDDRLLLSVSPGGFLRCRK